jgi:MFS family permease
VLDGLEITVAGSMAGVLSDKETLSMSSTAVGLIATIYLIGEIIGALFFGRLSDKLGRRNLFMLTLGVYLVGSGLTAVTWNASGAAVAFLYITRIIAGMGIGGEYAAINSAIDELIPARYRGRVDIAVNGTYWGGAIIGTLASLLFLNVIGESLGWRLGFLVGPVLGLVILFVRRNLPESPRWLVMHGRADEAEASIRGIEEEVHHTSGKPVDDVPDDRAIEIKPTDRTGYLTLIRVLFRDYPRRSVLGATLMITQSFLYNAIFFTYALVLGQFFHVSTGDTSYYFIAFAIGNLLGPVLLGPLFDTLGRRFMISGTYLLSGAFLAATAVMFDKGMLTATTQTICWCVIFFLASAGASAAYLTVSEIFPMELRAQAIAVFFAIAQGFGALGPTIYGGFVASGKPSELMIGYLIGAGVMVLGAIAELLFGVKAERTSLEDIASPLSLVRKASGSISGGGAQPAPA